jgi:pilus assembly protein Flp/PilA
MMSRLLDRKDTKRPRLQGLERKCGHVGRVSFSKWRLPMFATLAKLLKNEDGATAIEYGLIAALIAVAAVTVLGTVGTNLTGTFSTVATKL